MQRARRVARWLASSRGPRVAVLLGALATLPALRVGLLHDDLMHRTFLDGVPGYRLAPHQLYDFTTADPEAVQRMIDHGYMPWFADPRLALRFFRPLSSLLLTSDDALFGQAALPAHVHSLLWFALIAIVAAAIFRRTLRPTSATVATLVFALAGAHAMTTAWLAARHTLVGASFGALVVWAHLRWRQDRWRPGAFLAPLFLIGGMLASETALGSVVFVALYELIVPRERMARRALHALPVFALGLAHLAFYALAGYGTRHSGTYISPFADPLAFAEAIVIRGPLLIGELYGAAPVMIAAMVEQLALPVAIYGLVMLAGCALVLYRAKLPSIERRRLLWLGSASVVCLAPMVGGVLGPRLLALATIGSAAVVGAAIVEGFRAARSMRGLARVGVTVGVMVLVSLHLGFAPLVRTSLPGLLAGMSDAERQLALDADLSACPQGAMGYVLTGADPVLSLYAAPSLHFYTPQKAARLRAVSVVSMAEEAQELRTVGDRVELAIIEPRTANLFERVYRDEPMRAGDRVEAGELRVTVLDVEDGWPTRVAMENARGWESACFLVWQGGRLRSMPPPDPGEVRVIAHELGPMGL